MERYDGQGVERGRLSVLRPPALLAGTGRSGEREPFQKLWGERRSNDGPGERIFVIRNGNGNGNAEGSKPFIRQLSGRRFPGAKALDEHPGEG